MRPRTETFDIMVDGTPVHFRATPFETNNNETKFRISYNDSPIHIFAWDEDLNRLTAIDNGSEKDIPGVIDEAIGMELAKHMAAA